MGVFISGLLVGAVMGLTGSGGALVAIPLFVYVLGMSLKDATSFSLVAVILASLINFIPQRQIANKKVGFLIIPFAILGSYFSIPLKVIAPEILIKGLITAIALYSFWSLWSRKPTSNSATEEITYSSETRFNPILITPVVGIFLGALTTLTGLGGGVLLMPVLVSVFDFSTERAVATSFIPIGFTSLFSLIFQWQSGFVLPSNIVMLDLCLGIFLIAVVIHFFIHIVSAKIANLIRKWVFSVIVFVSLFKIWET